jgi:hypothetical protein
MSSDEDPRGPEVEDSVGGEYAFTVTNDDEMVGSPEIDFRTSHFLDLLSARRGTNRLCRSMTKRAILSGVSLFS